MGFSGEANFQTTAAEFESTVSIKSGAFKIRALKRGWKA
jgi:hypothetical protein